MNCKVNEQMVAQRCFQIAQGIHNEFVEELENDPLLRVTDNQDKIYNLEKALEDTENIIERLKSSTNDTLLTYLQKEKKLIERLNLTTYSEEVKRIKNNNSLSENEKNSQIAKYKKENEKWVWRIILGVGPQASKGEALSSLQETEKQSILAKRQEKIRDILFEYGLQEGTDKDFNFSTSGRTLQMHIRENRLKQLETEKESLENELDYIQRFGDEPFVNPENNSIIFYSEDEARMFEEEINKTFPLPNKSVTERSENNTILLKNLDDVALIYSLKNEAIAPIRAQSDMGLNKQSMRNITGNKQNTDLIANLKNILAQTNAKLFNYYNKYSNSEATSKVERQEIMRNYRILLAQQRRIEDILSQIDNFDNDKMIKSVDSMLDMFTEMFNILNEKQQYNGARGVITDPDILYLFRQINEAAAMFFDAYGSMGEYMLNEMDDKGLIEKINEQLNKWNGIKKAYRDTCDVIINNLEKEAEKYEKSENFKTGLQKKWQANLKRQIEKGLKDINALNGLFAFDNAFQENTVYPKIMSMIADKLDIETFNDDFWKLNEQFDVIVKKLRRKGIDLSDSKSYGRYFLERLSDGTETGRLATCFTPKFRNDTRSFMARQVKSLTNITDDDTMRQRSRLQDFIDNYDVLDIMKLKEAYDENSELYRILQVLTTTVEHDENGETLLDENGNIVFSGKQWSQMVEDGDYTYDEDYEKKMKGLLGADYDRILAQYIKLMSEATLLATQRFDENGQPIFIMEDVMDEENPFFIMQYLNSIKSSKKSTNVLGKDKMYYNLNRMVYIPDSSRQEYFNMDFVHMCSESNPDREELLEAYNFFRMVFGDIAGTLYMNDAENTAYAKIPLDSYLDIMANTKDKRVKKQIGLLWSYMKSKFWDDKKEKKDMSKTNLNYSDMYNKTYWAVMESLKGTSYDQETREKMAYQIANDNTLYEHDFIKLTKNIMMLAAIQKRNNIMVEYMTLMRNRFAEIKTNMESTGNKEDAANQRTNALKAWDDQLSRGFKQQGIESNRSKKATTTKGEFIDIIKNASYEELDNAIDRIMKKQKLHIRSNDRAVINSLIRAIKAINDSTSLENNFDFEYKGDTYSYRIKFSHGEMVKVFRKNGSPTTKEKFVRVRSEFLMEKIVDFGYECGWYSIQEELMNLARLGALGGYVMTIVPGIKNRIDGLVADADMDARGFGFTPGNLAAAQRFMMGATLPMGLEGEGMHKFMQMFLTKKAYKRFIITKILGTRMKIFQDMTNLLDKNTGGSTMSAWKNNLNPYNMAVQFPEIRNQYDLFIARLLDYKIKDKDGKEHNFIENNEFVALDLDENGNIKLKDDFNPNKYDKGSKEYENTKRNIQWETFQTEIESDDPTKRAIGEKDISDVVAIAIDQYTTNRRANGDYRDMFKKLYSANWASRMLMQMKTYAPERFKAAWSKGENEDLLGEFYTAAAHGFFTNAALVSSAIRKGAHGGLKASRVFPRPISRTIKGVTYGTAAIGMIIAAKHNNILKFETKRLKFDLMFLKALLYEEVMFLPRTVLKTKTNSIKFVFGKEGGIGSQLFNENIDAIVEQGNLSEDKAKEYREYVENMTEEQKRQHQGNLCALARTIARATYGHILRVFLSYVLFQIINKIWGDDDDDEKNKELIKRRKQFVANNMKDITESTSTLYQMSFGLGDSYQNVMMVSKIDNIIKGLNQMQNLQYSSGTEKIIKNTAIIKSLMTHGFESTYKSNESDWEMAAYALDDKELDKDNYYDKVFASRATKLKQQLTQSYMDAKKKETFPSDELNDLTTMFIDYNDGRKENKIDLPSDFDIYKLTDEQFKTFLNAKLLKFDGETEDMYGDVHTGTNRDKVLEYQRWFKEHPYLEPSESGLIPDEMYIDEFSNNPTFEMDIIKMLKDYTGNGGEIINDDEKEKIDDIDARLDKLLR